MDVTVVENEFLSLCLHFKIKPTKSYGDNIRTNVENPTSVQRAVDSFYNTSFPLVTHTHFPSLQERTTSGSLKISLTLLCKLYNTEGPPASVPRTFKG